MNSLKKSAAYKKLKELGRFFRNSSFAKRIPTRILRKFLVKKYKQFAFERKLRKAPPILVFQMGKVGSTSIFKSLEKKYPGVVLHTHYVLESDWQMEHVLDWAKKGNPIKIISPIREPIGRNVSAFFHFTREGNEHKCDISMYSVQEQVKLYLDDSFPRDLIDAESSSLAPEFETFVSQDFSLEWFENNIEKYFSINVYKKSFPDCGHARFSHNNIDLLVLRIDISDEEKELAIRGFLEFPEFELKNENIGSSFEYASQYKLFKKQATLPEEYLNKMCDSKYFRHFYSEDKINSIRKKWI